MTLIVVFTPFLNFLLMTFLSGRIVSWRHLSAVVISNMVGLLALLLAKFPDIVAGKSYSTTVGNWLTSALFEVH